MPPAAPNAVRARRRTVALSVLLVALLLLEAVPSLPSALGSAPGTAGSTASPSSNVSLAAAATPAPAPAAPEMSPAQSASLCLLGVLPGCGVMNASSTIVPAVTATDPPSSWTDLTNLSRPTPAGRFEPSMAYSPADHGDLLFGGYGEMTTPPYAWVFYQDTWLLRGTTWTELVDNTTCAAATCPSPRAGAMIASLGTAGVLLFGGYSYTPSITRITYSDTWVFSGGRWRNITSTAGTAPSPRFDGGMSYDSLDNLVVLFGGSDALGNTWGDTWEFANGQWANVTASLTVSPQPRAGAAMATSPDGHILMYGGENNGVILENACVGVFQVAWWFYHGNWTVQSYSGCVAIVQGQLSGPSVISTSLSPPCGRVFPALGWSRNNGRFVLYGGKGPPDQAPGSCTGFESFLNDTWYYLLPPGGGFAWQNVTDAGDPPAREQMAYAGDLSDGYFVIFGGYAGGVGLAETWRFFELVHARLTGPTSIDTSGSLTFNTAFVVTGYGGSSNLTYTISTTGLKTTNTMSNTGDCARLNGGTYPIPYDGSDSFLCMPTQQSYNIYRARVFVQDVHNASDYAYANWTFTVLPPEAIKVYSQYITYFYVGFDFTNTFTVFTEVANAPAASLTATLGGLPLGFTQRTGDARYWDAANVEMAHVSPGSSLSVTADFNDWTLNATYPIHMIDTPDWLQTIYAFPYGDKATSTKGSGPYNHTYSVSDTYSWNIGKTFNFSIPVPLVSGNYSLVPSVSVAFGWDSTGNVSLTGTFTLAPPTISLGAFSLKLSAALSLKGTFALDLQGPDISGIKWLSADAKITITGDFSGSIPIYGFSFNLLGQNISVGFTLNLDVKPSVALDMLLAPTTQQPQEIIDGIGVMMKQLIGSFKLPLTAAVQFSIGIASVEFGGTLAVALAFNITPTFSVTGGSVTGDIFVGASFLFWSGQWDLVGPGTIFSWGTGAKLVSRDPTVAYNNGSGVVWVLRPRYYGGPGYDANVWNGTVPQGTAISDIYPSADPVAAGASNGAFLFYTDDNAAVPVNQGLTLSGLWLDADTNQLRSIPAPADSGYLVARPQATTLADGSLYVIWDALPLSETAAAGPQDLTVIALHGARYDPWNRTWGPIRDFTTSGIADSYQVDPTGSSGRVVAFVTATAALGSTTPEQLLQFDVATGAQISSANVTGVADVVSTRGASSWAVVRGIDGQLSVLRLSDGSSVSVSYSPPAGSALLSERFETGSASTLVLLFRGPETSQAVLFDLSTGAPVASLALGGNVSDVQALVSGSTSYVFALTAAGIQGWTEQGGSWTNLTRVSETGVERFGVVQSGSSLLLYALARSGGNDSAPLKSLVLAELGAALPQLPSPAPTSSAAPTSSSDAYVLYLGIVAAADAVALAVVVVWRRKRGGSPPVTSDAGNSAQETPPPAPPEDPSRGR